jgi:hypothetical protein
MIERSRLHCHACDEWFIAELDMELSGQHEIVCPNCGHIHYRIIQDGQVTGERYRSSNGYPTYYATSYMSATTDNSTGGITHPTAYYYLANAWMNTGTGS